MPSRVFFITGTSSGFGRELVKKCLAEGDKVVATARKTSSLSFEGATEANYRAVACDVTDMKSVDSAFEAAVKQFGRIDVVVNNAGYGLRGVFESISNEQGRTQMEVNFFGVVNVTRAAIKTFRANNQPVGGRVLQVSSIGGQRGMPSFSFYNASKFAVEGLTEGLSKELKPEWNIHLTCIEPGAFRTEWAGHSMAFGEIEQPAYDHIDVARLTQEMNGHQSGDPVKGARAFWDIAKMDDPPLRVVIGSDAQRGIANKIQEYSDHYLDPKWKAFAASTDFN